MDNWPSHKSKATLECFKNMPLSFKILPTYSPDLAPVELSFGFIKQKLSKQWRSLKINLKKKESKNHLLSVLKLMTSVQVKSFNEKFFITIKKYLHLYK